MDGAGGRSYEDFKPPHKMVREPPTHTLTIDLSAKGKALLRLQFFMSSPITYIHAILICCYAYLATLGHV